MLFNTPAFLLLFFPVVLGVYVFARNRGTTPALATLLLASLVFYGFWNWRYVPLLLVGIFVNYAFAVALQSSRSRALLAAGIVANILPLVWVKYAHWLGAMVGMDVLAQELPLGISFFTFLQIAFLIDTWSGRIGRIEPLSYAVFVSYFPHLVAGPILRYGEIAPQLARITERRAERDEQVARGLLLIVVGLFKKVVIADSVAPYVNTVFGSPATASFWDAWTGAIAFTVQLYFDFSAYCEIALGLSLLLGIAIPINFYSPYRATNITEHWRRWHISLSFWFRDYVYVPLGGSRAGVTREYVALGFTFLLAGLWHGASWTFVLWGAMHGAMVAAHRLWKRSGVKMPASAAQLLTLLGVVVAWVMFRANSVDDALTLYRTMSGIDGIVVPIAVSNALAASGVTVAAGGALHGVELIVVLLLLAFTATQPNVHELKLAPTRRWSYSIGALMVCVAFGLSRPSDFLYWSF